METAALCKPIQRFADLLRIPGTWVLTGLGKLLAALGSFPHFPQPLRLLHTHLYWRFLECQLIEVTLTQNGHLTHHEIPSVASLRPGGYFPRIGWPVSPEYAGSELPRSDAWIGRRSSRRLGEASPRSGHPWFDHLFLLFPSYRAINAGRCDGQPLISLSGPSAKWSPSPWASLCG